MLSSSLFDRGFLRPDRSVTPRQFLTQQPTVEKYQPFPPLPDDSPSRRYVTEEDGPLAACPLWDMHLYASGGLQELPSEHWQNGALLAEVATSPALARIGWLQVSFHHPSVLNFLRTGNFVNVETLVLNSGPFPEVLLAVAENESFRSLRYVRFGKDRWAWASPYARMLHYLALADKLQTANERHVPFGEMWSVLRNILHDTPLVPVSRPTVPVEIPEALQTPTWRRVGVTPAHAGAEDARGIVWLIILAMLFAFASIRTATREVPDPPAHKFDYKPDHYKIPPAAHEIPVQYPPASQLRQHKTTPPEPGERKDFVGPPRD
jgi:hypothetical protein